MPKCSNSCVHRNPADVSARMIAQWAWKFEKDGTRLIADVHGMPTFEENLKH